PPARCPRCAHARPRAEDSPAPKRARGSGARAAGPSQPKLGTEATNRAGIGVGRGEDGLEILEVERLAAESQISEPRPRLGQGVQDEKDHALAAVVTQRMEARTDGEREV